MKVIIEVSGRGSVFRSAAQQVAAARKGKKPDFRLSFESARSLFAELTPARLDLLDTLRRIGPCSVYALAKEAERNYSNVHTDVARMEELGLSNGPKAVRSACHTSRSRSSCRWPGLLRRNTNGDEHRSMEIASPTTCEHVARFIRANRSQF